MSTPQATNELVPREIARDMATRAIAVVGLAGIALIHLLDSISKYGETRYLFWMYVALMAGSLVLAGLLLHAGRRIVWAAAGALAASAIAGYVLSRTTGLPSADGDIGNWTEPLGLAALFVEGSVVAVSAYGFAITRRAEAAIERVDAARRRPAGAPVTA
jgi:hypothetical protein